MRWWDEWDCSGEGRSQLQPPPLLTSDGIHKIRGYSSTCICPQMIQLLFSEIQNKSWEKKLNKNTRLHTIFITSCPGTRRAFIFLSKLHNLSHRGYSHPQHTSLRSQKWKCCRSQNYSKTGTLKKQTKHFLFTTWASQREIAPSWYNLSRRGTSSNMSGLPIPAVMWVVVEVLGVFPSRSPSHFPHAQSQAGTAYDCTLFFVVFFLNVFQISVKVCSFKHFIQHFPVSIQRASERASEKQPRSAAFTKSNNDEKKVKAFKKKSTLCECVNQWIKHCFKPAVSHIPPLPLPP